MGLKVTGAGFGRTGTRSLKTALEELGYGNCYHMEEIMKHPHHLKYWGEIMAGSTPDTIPQRTGLWPLTSGI